MNNSKTFRRHGLLLSAAILAGLWGAGCGDRDDVAEAPTSSTTIVSSTPDSQTRVTTVTTEQASQRGSGNIEDGVPVDNENTNAGPGGATGTETEIADEINKKIIRNPQMTGSRVNVVVDAAGMATISGFTQNQQQKALALKAAKETAGVLDVKDKLEIRPTGGTGKTPKPAPQQPQTTIVVVPQAGSSTGQNQQPAQPKQGPKFSPESGESEEPSEGGTTEGETGSSGERLPGTPVGVGPDSGRN
jgi:hypothetical protein